MTSRSLGLALFWLAGLAACTGEEPAEDPMFPEDFALAWPEVRDCRFSVEHDGVFITVHASPAAADPYVNGNYPLPVEAILVKREFRDGECTELEGYTAMERLADGAAPDGGDWYWQEVDASHQVIESGAPPRCVSCHQSCTMGRDLTCTNP